MAELKSCETCSYIGKGENDYPCNKCTRNASDQWRPMSNADRIRSMSDEELAEYIFGVSIGNAPCVLCSEECVFCELSDEECKSRTLKWLQSETE